MNELILFGSAFFSVLLLGLNSLNVNAGRYVAAFITSSLIGFAQLSLYKAAPHVETLTEGFAFVVAGPLAIVSAMLLHRWFSKRRQERVNER